MLVDSLKRGRSGGRRDAYVMTRAGSRCMVSRNQVRPFQMSRTVFSLTPKARAILEGLSCCLIAAGPEILILKISIACSAVKMALVLQALIEDNSPFSPPLPLAPWKDLCFSSSKNMQFRFSMTFWLISVRWMCGHCAVT